MKKKLMLGGVLLLVCSAAVVGCSDSDGDAQGNAGSSNAGASASAGKDSGSAGKGGAGSAGAEPAAGAAGEVETPDASAVYALTTQIIGEQSQSYVLLTRTLDADTTLRLEDGVVEIAGRALGTGPDGGSSLFIANDAGPEITRYELNAEGGLDKADTVSFLGKGVTAFGEYGGQFQYISAEKAYWFDGPTAQVVVWNPSEMAVSGDIPLPGLATEGQVMSFTAAPVWSGKKLYTFVAWRKGVAVVPRAAVVVLDTETDEATIVEDTHCGYVRDGVLASDGKLYLATEAFGVAAHHLDITNPKPCMLRFDPETNTFDDSFQVLLEGLTPGGSAATLVVGPDEQAFLRFLDVASIPEAALAGPRQLASSGAWGWALFTPGDEPALEPIADVALGGGSVLPFKLGKRVFAPLFVAATTTEFTELTAAGPSTADAITIPGLVFSATRLTLPSAR